MEELGLKIPNVVAVERDGSKTRVAAHSHILGLGLDDSGRGLPTAKGMVGQTEAREAAGLIVDLIKSKKLAGKAVLLAGPPGTGKTAIAIAISRELGQRVPFCAMSAAEIYSHEVKKTEILTEHLRRAIGLRIREIKEVYEGEITDLSVEETENPHGGYGKTVSAVMVTLKAAKGTRTLKLAPQIHENLQKQKVKLGDVIYVESLTGNVKRLGRCDQYSGESDLEVDQFVPLPKGEVFKGREVIQDLTLHDLDIANSKPQGGSDMMSIITQFMTPRKTEITERLRREVDCIADKYITDGLAELTPGVLFIDEAHMLDLESFAYLNRAIEATHSPILIFATNRGMCRVNGTEKMVSPHGIPMDFLDRLLIIKTPTYTVHEAIQIIAIRARTEGVKLEDTALQRIAEIGATTSLRFALQLLSPSAIIANIANRDCITVEDVEETETLFLDGKSSAQRLRDDADKYYTS